MLWISPDPRRELIEEGMWTWDTEDVFNEVAEHLQACAILGFGVEVRNVAQEKAPESLDFAPTWQYRIYKTLAHVDSFGAEIGVQP